MNYYDALLEIKNNQGYEPSQHWQRSTGFCGWLQVSESFVLTYRWTQKYGFEKVEGLTTKLSLLELPNIATGVGRSITRITFKSVLS
jgi:hypothetical protein